MIEVLKDLLDQLVYKETKVLKETKVILDQPGFKVIKGILDRKES